MPRKVNYGIDYDERYDDYEDYDYDHDDEYETEEIAEVKAPNTKIETVRPGVWHCPICTYDNEESMLACDICGVLRNPLVKSCGNGNMSKVGGICRDSGASIMAKSLFASLPHRSTKKAVTFQPWNNVLLTEEGLNFHKLGNIQGHFHDFHKAFSSQNQYKVNIAPFKFDVPSPDDIVSNGMRSSKIGSKGTSSSLKEANVGFELKSNAGWADSSSTSVSKSTHDDMGQADFPLASTGNSSSLPSNMNNLSLSAKSGSGVKGTSHAPYQPEKWMLPDQKEGHLSQLNLAIVGHVDSGKSTLSGRLLHLLGRISQKEMNKYEKDAKLQGKGSFAYAWALDESSEERERGITMTVAVAYFNSKRHHVVLLDSPGHKDFVPNMISGATQSDAAILVIDASIGSFEAGMDNTGGQTREHAQLIRSFGVDQVIVAVNKMDAVKYSKERFDTIKTQLGAFLRSCSFKDSSLSWVPISAMENQNLVAAPSDVRLLSWHQGPCLLDAIDSLQPPARDYSRPLLMPICDVIKSQSQGQVSACGKLEAGALRSGFKVLVMPSGEVGTVRSLERDSQACSVARAGDNVVVSLQGIDGSHVMAGGMLCHPDFPVPVANRLELKVLTLDITTPILIGSQMEFHIHHAKEAATVARILSLLDPKTGKVMKKAPRCLMAKQNAVIEVVLQDAVCVEVYSSCRAIGRVFLRASGRTVALGIVTRIVERDN